MQCMHSLCPRVSSCSSHESTLGPLAATRNEPATRSNPIADVRKEIQKMHEARQTSTGTDETRTGVAHSSPQQPALRPDTATPRVYTYLCPYCAQSLQSTVATGCVDHRRGGGCGKQFRVNGLLASRAHSHTCPTCGTVVHSTQASGRIQITHRNPNGRQCRTDQWRVNNWWKFPSWILPLPGLLLASGSCSAHSWTFACHIYSSPLECMPAEQQLLLPVFELPRRGSEAWSGPAGNGPSQTAGPWGTDRGWGPRPPVPNVTFWTCKKTSCFSCFQPPKASPTAPSPHQSRALRDGPGLRATAPSA